MAERTRAAQRRGAPDPAWLPAPGDVQALVEGRHGDPFAVLGRHATPAGAVIRAFVPGARAVTAVAADGSARAPLAAHAGGDHASGLFVGPAPGDGDYRLVIEWPDATQDTADAYAFGPLLGDMDLHLIAEGSHWRLADALGAHACRTDGSDGVRFAVWAPNARRASVVGDFNGWDERRHPMRHRGGSGVWELFVPGIGVGARYKYALLGRDGNRLPLKADPVARAAECPPATASVVVDPRPYRWRDAAWMAQRAGRQARSRPLSIYELHSGSWIRGDDGAVPDWDALGDKLIPYVADMGFTHIELLPVAEHPFSGSWGYQPLGLFAPTARHGDAVAFARFVDRCHREQIGVILDWVPAHFPSDAHGLAHFDGTALYEHADPREGFHQDWNTLIYNHGRHEVAGFVLASALEWLERYHVDGLRVDAVASMLYRDYSRNPGEWVPNVHGGRENYESIAFLRRLNEVVHQRCPGALVIAEESTAWPGVSAPVREGGLGFAYKWNMGWMHDSLQYFAREPIHRTWHHDELSFSLMYAFSERFVLPISHDEVVHGKGSLLTRMPGDRWQQFANVRAFLAHMWMHPGKKLLFMGCEFAQAREWNHDASLDWHLLDDPAHRGVQRLVRDLNRLLLAEPALHARDAEPEGFRWIVGDDRANSVYAWLREADGARPLLAVLNLTPAPRTDYRVGVPSGGWWRELLNTDSAIYGGSDGGNGGGVQAGQPGAHGMPASLSLTVPPLSVLVLAPDG